MCQLVFKAYSNPHVSAPTAPVEALARGVLRAVLAVQLEVRLLLLLAPEAGGTTQMNARLMESIQANALYLES